MPKNTVGDAVLVEHKSGTKIDIDDSTPIDVNTPNQVTVKGTVLSENFLIEVALGNIDGYSIVHQMGAGEAPNGSFEVVSQTGDYKTPIAATSLEIISSNANDNSSGSGARELTIIGLDANWDKVTQTVATNGTTAVALTTDLIRVFDWHVTQSGTYATATSASHAGDLTIQESGGGAIWDTIPVSPVGEAQSSIGVYTVPNGYTAYLLSKSIFVDSNKDADLYFFQRPNADDVTATYTGVRKIIEKDLAVSGGLRQTFLSPRGTFIGACDIGYMAKGNSSTANVSVEFELLLVQDGY